MNPYISLNKSLPTPIFTSMGWNGIPTVTVDLSGLAAAGETFEDARGLILALEAIFEKYALAGITVIEEIIEPHKDALEWFNENTPQRSRKLKEIPSGTIALDNGSRRYIINFSSVYRYRNFTDAKGYCVEDYYCLATDAPECVRKALKY